VSTSYTTFELTIKGQCVAYRERTNLYFAVVLFSFPSLIVLAGCTYYAERRMAKRGARKDL
jgi:hypothetical protein